MNNFIKQVIEEKFASKAQQRYFYAQAGKGGKKGKKWSKWAKEFSDDTDFDKIPEKIEAEVDEVVDEKGNIKRGEIPIGKEKTSTLSKKRTDKVVKTGAGAMGAHGVHGTQSTSRYSSNWGTLWEVTKNIKEIEMDSALGYEDTLGSDASYKEALRHFTKTLGLPEDEAKERLKAMGYIPDEEDLVRLVENPKEFIRDYIESVLVKKSGDSDIVDNKDIEINPLVLKQLESLKKSLIKNNIPVEKIINHLKGE
jgi:hypothetical protein